MVSMAVAMAVLDKNVSAGRCVCWGWKGGVGTVIFFSCFFLAPVSAVPVSRFFSKTRGNQEETVHDSLRFFSCAEVLV